MTGHFLVRILLGLAWRYLNGPDAGAGPLSQASRKFLKLVMLTQSRERRLPLSTARLVGVGLGPPYWHSGMREGDASIAPTSPQTLGRTIPCCA
jgi:hypothetical protein